MIEARTLCDHYVPRNKDMLVLHFLYGALVDVMLRLVVLIMVPSQVNKCQRRVEACFYSATSSRKEQACFLVISEGIENNLLRSQPC